MCALLLAACVSVPAQQASADAITKAEEALAMAQKVGGEWKAIDKATGGKAVPLSKMLKVAKEKAAAGEIEESIRLAEKVTEFSMLGVEQAKAQEGAGPSYN